MKIYFRDFSKCRFWYWLGMVVLQPRPCVYWGITAICLKPRTSFPGGPVVKNPPWNVGYHQLDPWPGKITHAMGLLSPWATTTEPMSSRACVLQQEKPLQWAAHTLQLKSNPYHATTWENPPVSHNSRKPSCKPQLKKTLLQQQSKLHAAPPNTNLHL